MGAEWNTNRELIPDPALARCNDPLSRLCSKRNWGGSRHAPKSNFGRASVLQEFPDRDGIDPVELFCDLDMAFHTQRSEFDFIARYARQDSFNAEYGNANFDPFEPQNPGASDTGITYIGDTRKRHHG